MTYPVVATGLKKLGSNIAGSLFYAERSGARQAKPYNLNLPMSYRAGFNFSGYVQNRPPGQVGDYPYSLGINLDVTTPGWLRDGCVNKARERFISQCKSTTSFGESVAQWRGTRDLLAKYLLTVGDFATALLSGKKKIVKNLYNAASDNFYASKRLKRRRNHASDRQVRGWIKNPASAFIEGHFVWNPLFEDIRKLSAAMFATVPLNVVKATCTASTTDYAKQLITSIEGREANYSHYVKVKLQGVPRVTNPELLALDGLGILNAPLLAWNLLPFSWLADWFGNVSDLLGQLSDTRGYVVDNICYTRVFRGHSAARFWYKPASGKNAYDRVRNTGGLVILRDTTFPSVAFTCSIPPSLSWQRGLTVASLMALIGLKNK